jgi:hypothetical protein
MARSVLIRAAVALAIAALLVPSAVASPPVAPAPRDVLGFAPGDDRRLADYASVAEYFVRLAAASDRVRVEEIGRSTLGRPMLLATISSPANLARLDRLREVQRRLADPRTIATEADARSLVDEGRAVVLVTYGVHSTEVGSTLASTVLAYRLATDDSPEAREILDRCVVLVVPSLNPDGVDIVKKWYDASLGTPWEGEPPVELYHHYTDHDDNRDWYAFTQVETRAVVDRVHNVWHPHVVNDVHQQGSYGSRLFLPPYLDPVEPNVPPEIVSASSALGTAVAWRMTASGRAGVVTDAIYDAWTPSRAYSHYHGGARVLSETASAKLATPIVVGADELRPGRGYDARRASANFPAPWAGGTWRLTDVVDYMTASTWALLVESARRRETLLEGFYRMGREAVTRRAGEPFAFLVPPSSPLITGEGSGDLARALGRASLLDALARGGVELTVASAPFRVGTTTCPPGTVVVPFDQPYGAFAKALLERQRYPDLRQYAGGPPVPPYDVAAHTLSLLSGYEAVRVDDPFAIPAGSRYAPAPDARPRAPAAPARLGLYRGMTAPIDEGWTRWIFDRIGVGYVSLDERDVKAGDLRSRFDAILLPDMAAGDIAAGRAAGTAPPALTGGLGERGRAALARFVDEGGTLVALNRSSDYATDALELPVRDAVAGVPPAQFYCPGSILGIGVERGAGRATAGVAASSIAWFENGPAFEVDPRAKSVRVLARFAAADRLLQSGWLLGGERLAGRPALVAVERGRGLVVLFAFRPQYRGQSYATLPLLLDALAERR